MLESIARAWRPLTKLELHAVFLLFATRGMRSDDLEQNVEQGLPLTASGREQILLNVRNTARVAARQLSFEVSNRLRKAEVAT
jgi:hypothetical protein